MTRLLLSGESVDCDDEWHVPEDPAPVGHGVEVRQGQVDPQHEPEESHRTPSQSGAGDPHLDQEVMRQQRWKQGRI